ncbi:MAG TPA: heparan-alpha-glucosaminide N-acetyltransferase domain-containing protein [Chryseosolibacter sp.]|nr:heparan-alpha-glucosaminide N-acetyltransferase domain-containing protein [Chryseosolibacter sp.]
MNNLDRTTSARSVDTLRHGINVLERFLSLDVFRGVTICLMIIVNTPGKGATLFPYLVHARWFGFTLADIVFPSFLFAVGNAMSFSVDKMQSQPERSFFQKIIKRTLLVFMLGFVLYWFPFVMRGVDGEWIFKPLSQARIMGVLQRIAICYFFCALMIRYLSQATMFFVAAVSLLLYWTLLYVFGQSGAELSMSGNAIVKLDLFLLGENHIYKKDVMPFDPEGILSTLPSMVNVLAGYWTGKFIQRKGKTFECLKVLMVAGAGLVAMGLWWSLVFPISKKLWTSSFVLYTTGIDILFLSALIYLVELRGFTGGTRFFNVFGKNPLFIYLVSEVLYITLSVIRLPSGESVFEWLSIRVFQQIMSGPSGSLLTAVSFMLVCWCLGWWLDRRKVYIRL